MTMNFQTKPQKVIRQILMTRYSTTNPPDFSNHILETWIPQVVIVDAMFLVNTRPLRSNKTILFNCLIEEHLLCGAVEVHVVFDKPTKTMFDPIQIEKLRRDANNLENHGHKSFEPNSLIPQNWQNYYWVSNM
jgi:hypothetical protein